MNKELTYISRLLAKQNMNYFGICASDSFPDQQQVYLKWLEEGRNGDMEYLKKHALTKTDPQKILLGCKSLIMVGCNYFQKPVRVKNEQGRIARYAWGRDYHKVIGNKLKKIVQELKTRYPKHRFYNNTDATPLLERGYALKAGMGYIGKNTMLISQKYGSWFLIGEILTTLELPQVKPKEQNHGVCGSCARCQKACPTGALDKAYNIDARKCISYLTIEHKGIIPEELRPKMRNWLFGCDLCQEACPHNTRAKLTKEPDFTKQYAGNVAELEKILNINTDEQFLKKFAGSPVMRAKRVGLIRNACIVAGNNKVQKLLPILKKLSKDPNKIIAIHAQWACKRMN